ncbi:poly-gamma-glutamate synthase PgsB [Bacillus sp. FJAT-44742]|uniref:poly-gamma-glutamate synthase PgsB n=1 Tax=Bacillus sp. FJAT-44742 TaxID=2014005 RepID=UPI000C2331AB|nr:poly-gamma-glutamate synthase PgsB [Bacillus sp. FJAT-44742]
MTLMFLAFALVIVAGVIEKQRTQRAIDSIPLRVNVNGVRGKSTVTRLITGIVNEEGYKTVGKTTGTTARKIYWNGEEKPIQRKPEGPNIREQKEVLQEASKLNANAYVSECMAVNPDYQITLQNEFLQANYGVIVNVLEDHMDVLGPTLDHVAEAFTATIPHNGHLIINKGPYESYFRVLAKKRNTKVYIADKDAIPEDYLNKFTYMVFPDNVAIGLAFAEAAGIDKETALKGMLNANPDPGALRFLPFKDNHDNVSYFINGFAANDATSTLNIWKHIEESDYPSEEPVIILSCRDDRVERTEQFVKDVLPKLPPHRLALIGSFTQPVVNAYKRGELPAKELINLEDKTITEIADVLMEQANNTTLFGLGNIKGAGGELADYFQNKSKSDDSVKEEAM